MASINHVQGVDYSGAADADCLVQLAPGEVRSHRRNSQVLHVVSGQAWITVDGRDIVLSSGEEMAISPGTYEAVILALGRQPLTYEYC